MIRKKITRKAVILILLVVSFAYFIYLSYGQHQILAQEKILDTNNLQDIFNNAEANSVITLDEGTYHLSGYIQLPKNDNVTIDASKSIFSGSATFLSAENSGLKWKGGTFIGNGVNRFGFTLLHQKNAEFSGIQFNRATAFGQHVFDLLGCSNITFTDNIFAGYGNTVSVSGLTSTQKYAEAIQTDYALEGASGSSNADDKLKSFGGRFDGSATANILVKSNQFIPYKENGNILSWGQSPIGQHLYGKNVQNHDITFTKNTVTDPIPLNTIDQNKYTGAIHFVSIKNLLITDNIFKSSNAKRENWIQICNNANTTNPGTGNGQLPTSGVNITRNNFYGSEPTKSYINLVSDKNNAKFKITNTKISNNAYLNSKSAEPKNLILLTDVKSQIEKPNAYGNHGLVERTIINYTGKINVSSRVDGVYKSSPYGTPGYKKLGTTADKTYKNKTIKITEEQKNLKSTYVKGTIDGTNYIFIDKRAIGR
ncbi:SH3-like domain-containing protein [Anaerostipes sp.]|uniref:SH3-like domain-containing protein n=1 Tax=Anaerostipes sp. TaxID=1872530 RepID=UPI0025BB2CED|nr:SH3-like domain-containing protein [Anaerostipes sp.]MBS7007437.1 SH3-like domain-containing protein [Anaerostipes sp.]